MDCSFGIDKIGIYIPKYFIEVKDLAEKRNIDPKRWTKGLMQNKLGIISPGEDIISMGANAANEILTETDKKAITQVYFATETGNDFSKAASTYIKELLDLEDVRALEFKQACYAGTGALFSGLNHIRLNPKEKALIIMSDYSRYGLKKSGEATQGAGAIALILSKDPKILEIENKSFYKTINAYDFWRPSYLNYPLVIGEESIKLYKKIFIENYKKAQKLGLTDDLKNMFFHLPFGSMGLRALEALEDELNLDLKEIKEKVSINNNLAKETGNSYTASLYMSVLSFLAYGDELTENERVSLFSYGSGAVGELFFARVKKDYKKYINLNRLEEKINNREKLSIDEYEELYHYGEYRLDTNESYNWEEEGFYLSEVKDGKRFYKYNG